MDVLDRRPILVALAGPNGAGKTTFYRAFLASSGLYFVNADVIAEQLKVDAYRSANGWRFPAAVGGAARQLCI